MLALGGLARVPVAGLADASPADAPTALTTQQLAVLGGLASALVLAAGGLGDRTWAQGAQQQIPQVIAQGFAARDPISRASLSELLETIDRAPSPGGAFASLTDAQRQVFMRMALAPLAPPAPDRAEIAAMQALSRAAEESYAGYAARVQAGTLPQRIEQPSGPEAADSPEGPPHSVPIARARTPSMALAGTVLAGLELVCAPLTPPTASKPRTTLLPPAAALNPAPAHHTAPPPNTASLLPPAVLGDALAVWVLGA